MFLHEVGHGDWTWGVASSGEGREVEQDGGAYVENSVRKILDCPIRHIFLR